MTICNFQHLLCHINDSQKVGDNATTGPGSVTEESATGSLILPEIEQRRRKSEKKLVKREEQPYCSSSRTIQLKFRDIL